jgi:hypothetical protein
MEEDFFRVLVPVDMPCATISIADRRIVRTTFRLTESANATLAILAEDTGCSEAYVLDTYVSKAIGIDSPMRKAIQAVQQKMDDAGKVISGSQRYTKGIMRSTLSKLETYAKETEQTRDEALEWIIQYARISRVIEQEQCVELLGTIITEIEGALEDCRSRVDKAVGSVAELDVDSDFMSQAEAVIYDHDGYQELEETQRYVRTVLEKLKAIPVPEIVDQEIV